MFDNKERILAIIIVLSFIFSFFTIYVYSEGTLGLSAKAATLYEPETKRFLYNKNEHAKLPMASTTKIMTALIAIESIELDQNVWVDDSAIGIDGSSIYLESGECMSAESLIYALMLSSANDAAVALACEIAGSVDAFSNLMNEKAESLGLSDTHFANPHGLDSSDHYTSAHDLAIITAEALKNAKLCEICSTKRKEIESSHKTRILVNHNKLLKLYDGCIGVKTGYTQKSGRSLVGAAKRDDLTLISVTIDAPDDWNDHKKLLDYGFSNIHAKYLITDSEFQIEFPIANGEKQSIKLASQDAIKIIYDGISPAIEKKISLNSYLIAPITEGESVGRIIFLENGKEIASTDIIAKETVSAIEKQSFFKRLKK